MIHKLSRATSYLTTFYIDPNTGEPKERSRATGFFVRVHSALLLVTNWHVVTGLNPADPALAKSPPPHFLKATIFSKNGRLNELSLPLYTTSLKPLWQEHPDGPKVDIAIYPLSLALEDHFHFVDIQSAEDDSNIAEAVAKDVFILGYPFSSKEMQIGFGDDVPYYIPVWKRGTIATEPALQLGRGVLLIDSLSRSGMSGAPVVIAEDARMLKAANEANNEVMRRILAGESRAVLELDHKALTDETIKHFRFLGVYSGVIGSTRLAEVALGVCWRVDTLRELIENARTGEMPNHAPMPNAYLDAFLTQFSDCQLIQKDVDGNVIDRTSLHD